MLGVQILHVIVKWLQFIITWFSGTVMTTQQIPFLSSSLVRVFT